jgi:hypothetical protein
MLLAKNTAYMVLVIIENPLFPIANTITDINIDMIGRRDEAHAGVTTTFM